MPNEALISRIETLLDEVVSLGGASERTGIVSGLIVVDSAPSSPALANHIIVRDSRDGNFISVLKTPGQTYANNDLVSVLFIEGTEPIALAQSPGSSSGNVKVSEVWESDFGAVAGSADAAGNWTWQGDVTLASGNLNFSQASTIAVTGALQINATGGVVINEGGADVDLRIESDTLTHAFFIEGSTGRIGVNASSLSVPVTIIRTDANGTVIALENTAGNACTSSYTNNTPKEWNFGVVSGNGFAVTEVLVATQFNIAPGGNIGIGIGVAAPSGKVHVDQASTTGAIPVLYLDQADLSEEFIEFAATVGAGNPIDTAAIGTYYGKVRVSVAGVGFKFMPLHNS